MMDKNLTEEDLSIAYLIAVTTMAGGTYSSNANRDQDGFDFFLKKRLEDKTTPYGVIDSNLKVSLKATASKDIYSIKDGIITYRLKSKNHSDLLIGDKIAKYLFLLILPEDIKDWVNVEVDQLILRKSMYFLSYRDLKYSKNRNSVNVRIPVENQVTVENLCKLFEEEK